VITGFVKATVLEANWQSGFLWGLLDNTRGFDYDIYWPGSAGPLVPKAFVLTSLAALTWRGS
jgi:hypothetical protein